MALQKVHTVRQAALQLGPQDAEDPRILEIWVVVKDTVWKTKEQDKQTLKDMESTVSLCARMRLG